MEKFFILAIKSEYGNEKPKAFTSFESAQAEMIKEYNKTVKEYEDVLEDKDITNDHAHVCSSDYVDMDWDIFEVNIEK